MGFTDGNVLSVVLKCKKISENNFIEGITIVLWPKGVLNDGYACNSEVWTKDNFDYFSGEI